MKKARCLLSLLLCALLVCFPGAAQETPDFCEEYAALNGAPTPDGLHRYAAVELGAGLLEATEVVEPNPIRPNESTSYSNLYHCDRDGVYLYIDTVSAQLADVIGKSEEQA